MDGGRACCTSTPDQTGPFSGVVQAPAPNREDMTRMNPLQNPKAAIALLSVALLLGAGWRLHLNQTGRQGEPATAAQPLLDMVQAPAPNRDDMTRTNPLQNPKAAIALLAAALLLGHRYLHNFP